MIIKIVKLIDSNQHIFENKPYGSIDVRTSDSETEDEKKAAIKSLNSFNYATDNKNILRLVGIFERETIKEAISDSDLLFEETIDLLKRQFTSKVKDCEGAGYYVTIDTGETVPFLKVENTQLPFFNHVYQRSLGAYSLMFGEQIIASRRNEEATEAFIRSIHWHNNSKTQKRQYLQFLYKWIAIETITKIHDEEDIIPKLCLVLGFPLSKYSKLIYENELKKLFVIKNYGYYKNFIKEEFYKCREMRNEIVHSGFKETNLLNKNLKLKLYIIDAAYSCMINTIEKIIFSGKDTIKEIWNVMHDYIIKDKKLLKWISGTFLPEIDLFTSNNIKSKAKHNI